MKDYYREAFEALKQTAEAMIHAHGAIADANHAIVQASAAMATATNGIKRAAEAALTAKNEHEDLRETVHRLESLVLQQGQEIRALREDLRGRG